MGLIKKWQDMLIGCINEYRDRPSEETALVVSANVDAVWDERLSNFVIPPAFTLSDRLLGEGLMKIRSGFRAAKWGDDSGEASNDINTGIHIVARSWLEAGRAAKEEGARVDALP